MRICKPAFLAVLLLSAGDAQGPDPAIKARIDGFIEALTCRTRAIRGDGAGELCAGVSCAADTGRAPAVRRARARRLRGDRRTTRHGDSRWRHDASRPRRYRAGRPHRAPARACSATPHHENRDRGRRSGRGARDRSSAAGQRIDVRRRAVARARCPRECAGGDRHIFRRRSGREVGHAGLRESLGPGRSRSAHAQRRDHAIQSGIDQQDHHEDRGGEADERRASRAHRHHRDAPARLPERRGQNGDGVAVARASRRHRQLLRDRDSAKRPNHNCVRTPTTTTT